MGSSGYLDYTTRIHIEKWLQTVTRRIDTPAKRDFDDRLSRHETTVSRRAVRDELITLTVALYD